MLTNPHLFIDIEARLAGSEPLPLQRVWGSCLSDWQPDSVIWSVGWACVTGGWDSPRTRGGSQQVPLMEVILGSLIEMH